MEAWIKINFLESAYQEKIPIYNFWRTKHDKDFSKNDFLNSPYNYNDWLAYKDLSSGKKGATVLNMRQGANNKFFNSDDQGGQGDSIFIWAPNEKLEGLAKEQEDYNYVSYILNVEHADKKVILGGDAYGHEDHQKENSWTEVLNWLNSLKVDVSSAVLKASHHGHENGYHQEGVKRMSPEFTIISDSYGNESIRSDLYRQWSDYVLSTFWCGNILLQIDDDGELSVFTERDRFNAKYIDRITGYFLVP